MEHAQMTMERDEGFLDLTGLSKYSSISKSTLRQYIKTGNLPSYRLGGKLLVKKKAFDHWIERFAYKPEDLNVIVDVVIADLSA